MKKSSAKKSAMEDVYSIWEQHGEAMKKIGEVRTAAISEVREFIADHTSIVHGNAEPVRVLAVDEEELKKWQPPRGRAKDIRPDHVYPSAFEASYALGYTYNEVSLRLGKARRVLELDAIEQYGKNNTIRLRPEVTLRGVRLQFEKDVKNV